VSPGQVAANPAHVAPARSGRWWWVAGALPGAALVFLAHAASGLAFADRGGDGPALAALLRHGPAVAVALLVCALLLWARRAARLHVFEPLQALADTRRELARLRAESALRERALEAGERRWNLMATLGEVAIWDYDCETGALALDHHFPGRTSRDGAGMPQDLSEFLQLLPLAEAEQVMQGLRDHLAGRTGIFEAEFSLSTADGGSRWYRARGQGVDADPRGRPRRVQGSLRDITGEKLAATSLAAASEEVLRCVREKSAFIASLCHELRTPLTGVLGMLSLLERETLSGDQREFVEVAQKSGRMMFGLIDDVLDLSRIEARAIVLEHVGFELRTLAEDVVDVLAEQAYRKGIDIVLHLEPGLPPRIVGDPARLRQVLLNLLGNAVRFTERGQVALKVRTVPASGGIRFEVADSGIGIPRDRQARIFEPFTQADDSNSRRYGGTGLGLSITRRLVGLMGATLTLESEVEVGSRFAFELPLDVIPNGHGASASATLAGRRILVQEPNAAVLAACATLLRGHGASVECICDPRELRPTLQVGDTGFDVVIFDAASDLFSSVREIAAVRVVPALRGLRFIASVPFGRRTDAADARALGADGFVTKPMREARLLRAIADALATEPMPLEHGPGTAAARPAAHEERRTLAGLTVLVVDDVITNLKVAAGMLARLGVRAELADSGRAALEAITRNAYPVILMDCQMPGMDGFETTALIRARHCAGDGPRIVAMTANAAGTDRDKCLAHGMDDYLAKPIMLSDLERVLHRWSVGGAGAARAARLAPVATAADAAHAIDRRKLDELAGLLSASEFHALCERFKHDGNAQLDAFARGLGTGNVPAVRQAAHALKGAAANMGAAALASLCRGLEGLPDAELASALESIREAFDLFCGQLEPAATIAA